MATKIDVEKLRQGLAQCTGTTQYHRLTLGGLKCTDGVTYLAQNAECFWLMDVVDSYQPELRKRGIDFQIWKIVKNADNSCVVSCREDDGAPEVIKQKIEYTTFPIDEYEFFVIDGVALLKSEY